MALSLNNILCIAMWSLVTYFNYFKWSHKVCLCLILLATRQMFNIRGKPEVVKLCLMILNDPHMIIAF